MLKRVLWGNWALDRRKLQLIEFMVNPLRAQQIYRFGYNEEGKLKEF
jgi:hypothetical protein